MNEHPQERLTPSEDVHIVARDPNHIHEASGAVSPDKSASTLTSTPGSRPSTGADNDMFR